MASIFLKTISLAYSLIILACTASLINHDEECLSLFEFKQTVFHENNDIAGGLQKFYSWRKIKSNTSKNGCCLFNGVVCSHNGHVIGLDLSGSSLSGVINSNSTLFNLVHLEMLDLSMNNFAKSQIPSEIARLKQLRSLNLSNSGFNGQIPNEISQLMQLSSLDLSWNPLKLRSSHGLEYLLQNMTRLEILYLSGVDLSSSVPRFLANFTSLRNISLEGCLLQNEFPSTIFHLPKLEYLSVGNNSNLIGSLPKFNNNSSLVHLKLFSTGFTGIIPESISKLNRLEVLALQKCYFSGPIPGSLSNLTQLTYLSLSENELTGLVPSLASLSQLTDLLLSYNGFKIGDEYGWVSKLAKLNTLHLSSMNIHDRILPYLANLTKLSFLSMERNFIFGRIPSSFMNLTQLIILELTENQLQGQISNAFLNFKDLEYLNIGNNEFSGAVGIDSFIGLDKLKFLFLNYNRLSFVTKNYTNGTLSELQYLGLSSCNLKEFPGFLKFQTKMINLVLSDNEIEGRVPKWIWNNSKETLHVLILSDNFITGLYPHAHFLPWIRLEIFDIACNRLQGKLPIPPKTIVLYDVSFNDLTGEIPPLICEAKSLQILYLSSNKLTGTLPPCLGNLNNSLFMLDLKQNNFHGPMINTCKHGSLLKMIDLSENRFTGHVSKSLANCTDLEFLSLADNSFEDIFPVWLGTLPKLQVLILRSNKFYGAIEGLSTINSQFMKLRIIDISNNLFSGQLSDNSFQNFNAMKSGFIGESYAIGLQFYYPTFMPYPLSYSMTLTNKGVKREYKQILNIFKAMDLSCNNFQGKIPQSLQDLLGLEALNLSNNHFNGHIFPSFGSLMNLESLDLSQNELSGKIPQQLLQLGFLSILNVSFNFLEGHIPQGKQFNTFESNSYLGNPNLCGKPLSYECKNSKVSTVLLETSNDESESLMPNDIIDWMVILLGVGSGLVTGIVIGSFLHAKYRDWLLERFMIEKVY